MDLDLGSPQGREAGFRHPAVIVTAQRILDAEPSVIHVAPMTSMIRGFGSEILVEPDSVNGLKLTSAVHCQHVRAVSTSRAGVVLGNGGIALLAEVRETIGLILDITT